MPSPGRERVGALDVTWLRAKLEPRLVTSEPANRVDGTPQPRDYGCIVPRAAET